MARPWLRWLSRIALAVAVAALALLWAVWWLWSLLSPRLDSRTITAVPTFRELTAKTQALPGA